MNTKEILKKRLNKLNKNYIEKKVFEFAKN